MSGRAANPKPKAARWRSEGLTDPFGYRGADDQAFDSLYPGSIQALSDRFWTPVGVARRVAELFWQAGAHTVMDVGSGAGKFVLIAASAVPEMHFVGIEQREHLLEAARKLQARLKIPNASFLLGDAAQVPWRGFDGFYFFNPFAENLFVDRDKIDDSVELSKARFVYDVLRTEEALRAAPLGTAVVTYHGMSGRMPASYELSLSEQAGSDWLRLWVKKRTLAEGFFIEEGDSVVLYDTVALTSLWHAWARDRVLAPDDLRKGTSSS